MSALNKKAFHNDISSSLPDGVKEAILTCLPLKDAVRTSVLSKNWRYSWTRVPHLKLDETLWPQSSVNKGSAFIKCMMRIFHVALNHEGPMTKVTLSIPKLKVCPEIDNLFLILSKNDVEDLRLSKCFGLYRLPSAFFRCHKLKHISLCTCLVHPPLGFGGFSQLLSIVMIDVSITSECLGKLVASCPLLEILKLIAYYLTYESLDIHAPKLKQFYIRGRVKSICFKNTPLLEQVSFSEPKGYELHPIEGNFKLVDLFKSLPALKVVHFGSNFTKGIDAGEVLTRASLRAAHLKSLSLELYCLDDLLGMPFVVFLLRISPNLENIRISHVTVAGGTSEYIYLPLDVEEYSDVKLDQLKVVEIKDFTGARNEMRLAKLLLTKSPRLEKMVIQAKATWCTEKQELMILKELIQLARPSPTAKIIYK